MNVQIIERDGQPEYAVLPYVDYLRLLQLAENQQQPLAGDDERVPEAVVRRLVGGDGHPLRIWREYRGLTQETLSAASGVELSSIREIEAGSISDVGKDVAALAKALGVGVDDLAAL